MKAAVARKDGRTRTVISSPVPTVEQTAAKLGVGSRRVHQLERMMDRRTCKGRLNGPGAVEGNLCSEGWTFYPLPGPSFAGRDGAAEAPYYTWVDQHDILGLGANAPIGTGNFSDSLYALTYGKVVQLLVPYPMGFFAKGVDGRIDDPKAGWKGRGLWVTSGNRTPMHIEGIDAPSPGAPGKTLSSPLVVHFQLRPDPLAH